MLVLFTIWIWIRRMRYMDRIICITNWQERIYWEKKYKTRQSPNGSYPQVSAKKLSPISKSAVLIRFLVFLLRNVKDHFMPLVRRLSHAQNHLELLFRPKKVVERKGAVRSLAFCVTRMRTILDFADLATIKIMDIWNDGRCVSFG